MEPQEENPPQPTVPETKPDQTAPVVPARETKPLVAKAIQDAAVVSSTDELELPLVTPAFDPQTEPELPLDTGPSPVSGDGTPTVEAAKSKPPEEPAAPTPLGTAEPKPALPMQKPTPSWAETVPPKDEAVAGDESEPKPALPMQKATPAWAQTVPGQGEPVGEPVAEPEPVPPAEPAKAIVPTWPPRVAPSSEPTASEIWPPEPPTEPAMPVWPPSVFEDTPDQMPNLPVEPAASADWTAPAASSPVTTSPAPVPPAQATVPPATVPAATVPAPTSVPPATIPPPTVPPTSVPPSTIPPATVPPASVQRATAPPASVPPATVPPATVSRPIVKPPAPATPAIVPPAAGPSAPAPPPPAPPSTPTPPGGWPDTVPAAAAAAARKKSGRWQSWTAPSTPPDAPPQAPPADATPAPAAEVAPADVVPPQLAAPAAAVPAAVEPPPKSEFESAFDATPSAAPSPAAPAAPEPDVDWGSAVEVPAWAPHLHIAASRPDVAAPAPQSAAPAPAPAPAPKPAAQTTASKPAAGAPTPAAPAGSVATPAGGWSVVEQKRFDQSITRHVPTPEDRSYAEWFAWAKRGGAPAAACHAAAQAAFRALAAGKDVAVAAQWAATGMTTPPLPVDSGRQAYCAWFSLGHIDLNFDQAHAHAFATGAVHALDAGADAKAAHAAGLEAAGIK